MSGDSRTRLMEPVVQEREHFLLYKDGSHIAFDFFVICSQEYDVELEDRSISFVPVHSSEMRMFYTRNNDVTSNSMPLHHLEWCGRPL
jgi:hypothetical protein